MPVITESPRSVYQPVGVPPALAGNLMHSWRAADGVHAYTAGGQSIAPVTYTTATQGKYWYDAKNQLLKHSLSGEMNPDGHLEDEVENAILQSADFTTTWAETGTDVVSANAAAAPDGTTTADTLTDNNSGASEFVSQAVTVSSDATQWTFSVFVKKTTAALTNLAGITMLFTSGGTNIRYAASINSTTGTTTEVTSGLSSLGTLSELLVEDYGTYWRLIMAGANNNSGNLSLSIAIFPALTTAAAPDTYSGTVTNSVTVWGAQLENTRFASSYIPTTTTAVTREQDSLSFDAGHLRWESGAMVIVLEPQHTGRQMITDRWICSLHSTGNQIVYIIWDEGPEDYNWRVYKDNSIITNATTEGQSSVRNERRVLVVNWGPNANEFYNGTSYSQGPFGSDLHPYNNGTPRLYLNGYLNHTNPGNIKLKALDFYDRPLTGSEVAQLEYDFTKRL